MGANNLYSIISCCTTVDHVVFNVLCCAMLQCCVICVVYCCVLRCVMNCDVVSRCDMPQ